MRQLISHLLILSLFFAVTPAKARARKTPPKASTKLLQWITPDWIDVNFGKNSEGDTKKQVKDLNAVMENLQNSRGSSGKNGGKGNGAGAGAGQTLKFNDNASKNGVGEQAKEDLPGDRGGQPPGGGDNRPPGDKPIVFDLYWPMCIFFDPSVSDGEANEIVKGTIDKAGACGVNLNVVPITIKDGYPKGSPDSFNPMQQASCNMQSIGVPVASTLLVNPHPLAAAIMCDVKRPKADGQGEEYDPGVAGCAQLRSGGMTQKQMAGMTGSWGSVANDGIIPSVIVPVGWNSGVASHEAIGHSQMGWPNLGEDASQKDAGLGIGTPPTRGGAANEMEKEIFTALLEDRPGPQFSALEGDSKGSSGWTELGCAQLRARALPNTHKFSWSPKQQVYTKVEKDPQRQWPLGKPLWGPIPPGGPPDPPPPIARDPRPEPPEQDKTKLVMDENGPKISAQPPPEDDGRHRKRKGGGNGGGQDIDRLLNSLRKNTDAPDDQIAGGKPPPVIGDGKSGASLFMDESAKKGGDAPSGDGGSSIGSGTSIGGGTGSSNSGSLTFDESAAKGGVGDLSSSSGMDRKPSSISEEFFSKPPKINQTKPKESSMDEGFFDSMVKAENKARKRVKGESLRSKMKERQGDAKARPSQSSGSSRRALREPAS